MHSSQGFLQMLQTMNGNFVTKFYGREISKGLKLKTVYFHILSFALIVHGGMPERGIKSGGYIDGLLAGMLFINHL